MSETFHLPEVNRVGLMAPFEWLKLGWRDFRRAPVTCLAYGAGLAALSLLVTATLYLTGQFTWFLVLAGGFLIVAPILGMGLYKAACLLERGEKPALPAILPQPGMVRADVILLGVALFVLFGVWAEAAYIVYGLSTYTLHETIPEFLTFLLTTEEGRQMGLVGSVIGGGIAFLAFTLVVVSAPMLLDEANNVFIAVITSIRSVMSNLPVMLLWAFLISALVALGMAFALVGLALVFPWIGLSSWHAYRSLVAPRPALAG
ncbi:DUF2189 domain-containing protein [Henriciella aquimarina]|uniref:DUF2189 domain-containing protein n=1 Tax=Henriciella aquimarina TaxID=545261 RepID=UPI000A01D58C|nr:DUF2189 domain-containing protein [Henriciella aquimarina]